MTFKMKGSPLQRNFGIGADSPVKQYVRKEKGTDNSRPELKGMDYIDYSPASGSNIPSFRDIVSLEQQQAVSKKLGDRRRDERKYAEQIKGGEVQKMDEEGNPMVDAEGKPVMEMREDLSRNIFGKLTGDVFGGKKVRERQDLIKDLKTRTPEEVDPTQEPLIIDTTEGQENTDKVNPNEISIVTNGEVTGKTNTSSRPEGTGPVIEDSNEGGFNIRPRGEIDQYGI